MTERSDLPSLFIQSAVIVGSILLAFSFDAMWENYQESKTRAELIKLLIDDFEVTQDELDVAIESAQTHFEKNTRLLEIISTGESIGRDEFSDLAYNFVTFDGFAPALSTYEAAVGRDGLASIHSVPFSRAVAKFYEWKKSYDIHIQVSVDMYYLGSTHEIRGELGSLGVLLRGANSCNGRSCIYPEQFDMSMEELREFIVRPTIYSGIENARIVQINMLEGLRGMGTATTHVLTELRSMQ